MEEDYSSMVADVSTMDISGLPNFEIKQGEVYSTPLTLPLYCRIQEPIKTSDIQSNDARMTGKMTERAKGKAEETRTPKYERNSTRTLHNDARFDPLKDAFLVGRSECRQCQFHCQALNW